MAPSGSGTWSHSTIPKPYKLWIGIMPPNIWRRWLQSGLPQANERKAWLADVKEALWNGQVQAGDSCLPESGCSVIPKCRRKSPISSTMNSAWTMPVSAPPAMPLAVARSKAPVNRLSFSGCENPAPNGPSMALFVRPKPALPGSVANGIPSLLAF